MFGNLSPTPTKITEDGEKKIICIFEAAFPAVCSVPLEEGSLHRCISPLLLLLVPLMPSPPASPWHVVAVCWDSCDLCSSELVGGETKLKEDSREPGKPLPATGGWTRRGGTREDVKVLLCLARA